MSYQIKKRLRIYLRPRALQQVETRAEKTGQSMSETIEKYISEANNAGIYTKDT
jgi:hypothetical protein